MKFLQTIPLLNKIIAFHRHFWNVYQLADRSQAVCVKSGSLSVSTRPAVSLIIYQRNAADAMQPALNAWKLQLDPVLDEMILLDGKAGMNGAIGKHLNSAIQSAKNSFFVLADSNTLPAENWLKLMTHALSANPEAGYALGSVSVCPDARLQALASHASKPENLAYDLVMFRKQTWARAGGYPADADVDQAQKVFILRLQNISCDHLVVEKAVAEYSKVGGNVWSRAFRSARNEGSLGLFAPVIWRQLGFILIHCLLMVAGFILLFVQPVLGIVVLLIGLIGAPMLEGWQMPFGEGRSFRPRMIGPLSRGWIKVIRWIGYLAGVGHREEARLSLDLEAGRAVIKIISQHPDKAGIVIFSSTVDWTYMFQRYQQIARQFARRNYLVFYRTDNSHSDAFAGFQEVEPGLFVTPAPLETFAELNAPIFYVNSPWLAPMVIRLKKPIVIYDHCDDISVSAGRLEDHNDLIKNARVVLSSSHILFTEDQLLREDALLMPNAVDFNWVAKNKPEAGQSAPEDLQVIIDKRKPIIGYTGALAEWFDYDLLADVCELCPEFEFVLIGIDYDKSLDQTRLLNCGNVTWLGHKPYQILFQYVWRLDVAIIPFRINLITLATSPVKLFEYFACQKPVICTALPECEKYDVAFIAHSADEFCSQIKAALVDGRSEKYIQQLSQIARQNTWEARVDKIIKKLADGGHFDLQ